MFLNLDKKIESEKKSKKKVKAKKVEERDLVLFGNNPETFYNQCVSQCVRSFPLSYLLKAQKNLHLLQSICWHF